MILNIMVSMELTVKVTLEPGLGRTRTLLQTLYFLCFFLLTCSWAQERDFTKSFVAHQSLVIPASHPGAPCLCKGLLPNRYSLRPTCSIRDSIKKNPESC